MNATHTTSAECQVLIVGSGPTGLVLAAQLLARGIPTRIIDKSQGLAPQSRAVGIQARTLELLDVMGLADGFLDAGHRVRRFRMYAGGRSLLNLDLARNGSPYGFTLHLPQHETERLLRARLAELGGAVEQGVELVRLGQDGNVVNVTAHDVAGREIEISAGYIVGCDGAHSRVRDEIGVAFEGRSYPQDFLLADVALEGAGRDDEIHGFFQPDGMPVICLPLGGARWRVVMPNAGDRGGRPPTFDEIRDLVEQRGPRGIAVSEPEWLSCFRCQLRLTTTYRRGRVMLAGDAAHVHSPAGGQGMNTGMMDAHNLAWKLALVADGRAPESLLDTYGHERVPVASSVLGFTDRIVGWSTVRQPVKRALRDMLVPAVTSLPTVQRRAARRLSQVSVAYPSSPLIRPDGVRRGPRPGERVPDVEVRTHQGSTRLFRVLGGGRHVLLVSGLEVRTRLESPGLSAYAGVLDVVDGSLDETARPGAAGTFALVRPDGILAVRGARKDTERLLGYLRQLCGGAAPEPAAQAKLTASGSRFPGR